MNLIKKVSIILVCITLFSFCVPMGVQAKGDEVGIGGKLLDPVLSLLVGLGDGAMTLLQKYVFGIEDSYIQVSSGASFWSKFIVIAVAVIAVGATIACLLIPGLQAGGIALALSIAKSAIVLTVGTAVTALTFSFTTTIVKGVLPNDFTLPIISVSPKEIFSNEIALLDVDFFNPMPDETTTDSHGNTKVVQSTAKQLQSTISRWYNILRDIAIVALLSILVYIGIRILISSTSNDKAKYKQMIIDWVVALCLLFVMQYIMSFSNILVNKITEIVQSIDTTTEDVKKAQAAVASGDTSNLGDSNAPNLYRIEDEEKVDAAWKALIESAENKDPKVEPKDNPYYSYFLTKDGKQATSKNGNIVTKNGDAAILIWPTTNALAQSRMELQFLNDDKSTVISIAWKLIYIVLVIFTFVFLITYVKRVIYMAFLTIIAPLVAMTYPIDKINDGKAQAFDMWLKEYIFNLLIQPMHLILYTILIGSAMDLAATNVVYVIVALGFMIPAEKLMRKFFGFEKAQTPGMLAGPAGAALVMSGMKNLLGHGPKPSKGDNSSSKGDSSSEDKSQIRQPNNLDPDVILGGGDNKEEKLEHDKNTDELEKRLKKERDDSVLQAAYLAGGTKLYHEAAKKNGISIDPGKEVSPYGPLIDPQTEYDAKRGVLGEAARKAMENKQKGKMDKQDADTLYKLQNGLWVPKEVNDKKQQSPQTSTQQPKFTPTNNNGDKSITNMTRRKRLGRAIRRSKTLLCGWNEKEDDK